MAREAQSRAWGHVADAILALPPAGRRFLFRALAWTVGVRLRPGGRLRMGVTIRRKAP